MRAHRAGEQADQVPKRADDIFAEFLDDCALTLGKSYEQLLDYTLPQLERLMKRHTMHLAQDTLRSFWAVHRAVAAAWGDSKSVGEYVARLNQTATDQTPDIKDELRKAGVNVIS